METMQTCAAHSKAGLIDALFRRGFSLADARTLADQLSATPQAHCAARDRIERDLSGGINTPRREAAQ
ncbi:hypothetical protein ABTY98_09820 [Streptomyces sp. NPDC096040]|uniref:hypothetical protein n=1 Tax=Streptomyces sp. NPDC096040 TaxID=3155541 RepID=UPI0033176773